MLRRRMADLLVLAVYVAISFGYVGWQILPHPGRYLIGGFTRDPEIFMWSFAWFPHAIATGTNPFVTHALYAPSGINLVWTAAAPGLAYAFTPVTLLFGPAVAYNVAAILLPALAAWTAYLLCLELTGSRWAAAVGGFLFGFSAALLIDELWGDIDITGVFLLPLVALVLVRYVRGELSGHGLAWRLGVLVGAQLWIALEFTFTLTLFLAIGLVLAFVLVAHLRPRLRSALPAVAGAYALGAVIGAPFVISALAGGPPGSFGQTQGSDLLSFVIPTFEFAVGGSSWASAHFRVGGSAYLGLPALVIVALFARRLGHSAWARFLVAAFVILMLFMLGAGLQVAGRNLARLPLSLTKHVPLFDDLFPFRIGVYLSLVTGVIVAVWTATSRGRIYSRPYVLPALAVVALFPAVWKFSYRAEVRWKPDRSAFFTAGLYKRCIPRDETVALFPFGYRGDALLWQAETNFWFRVAGDGLQQVTPGRKPWTSFDNDWVVMQLNSSDVAVPNADSLLAFAALHGIDRFVVAPSAGYPSVAQLRRLGPVQRIGGMLVAPACGRPPLTQRDLTTVVARYRDQLRSRPNIGYCLGAIYTALPAGLDPAGPLQDATPARVIAGQGVTCAAPPAGYTDRGFASVTLGVPANTYRYYAP